MKTLITCLLFSTASLQAAPLKAELSAKAAILINTETGAILYEKNAHLPLYPASITKVITALYALEKKGNNLDALVCASQDAVATVHSNIRRSPLYKHPAYRLEFGGTHMGIKTGEILPFRTLIYGLMLTSGNDAANVIGQYICGDVLTFMEELNTYVKTLGCLNTTLHTPHGLPHSDHKTTAYDMAKITQRALKIPFFRTVVKTVKYPRAATNKQPEAELFQHNALVKSGKFHYPKAIGVKTGYTILGGYTLVASAEDTNRKLIAVVLGCEQIQQRYKDAITLFEAAFNEEKCSRTLFSKAFDHFSCTLPGGTIPLEADLATDLILEYYPSEEPLFTTEVQWDPPAFPIEIGAPVGQVAVLSKEGKVLMQNPLFAVRPVDSTFVFKTHLVWESGKAQLKRNIAFLVAIIGVAIVGMTFYFFHHKRRVS